MVNTAVQKTAENAVDPALARVLTRALGCRSIVLVGMMGAGKSSVGRRLAARLNIPFVDADAEIEGAAGMTIAEIFAKHGEPYFRAGETRVIARLLESGPQVLATGGGAVMDQRTRDLIHIKGISVWLKADLDTLMERVSKKQNRPLLKNPDPRGVLERLMIERYPVYALAALTVPTRDERKDVIAAEVFEALHRHFRQSASANPPKDRT
jgi:shikimate kinase